jgi:hypothetical protein
VRKTFSSNWQLITGNWQLIEKLQPWLGGGAIGLASTIAFTRIQALATLVAGLTSALALAGILTLAVMRRTIERNSSLAGACGHLMRRTSWRCNNSRPGGRTCEHTAESRGRDGQCLLVIHDKFSSIKM